ncbi:MAG: transcriptional repressor LexA [Candidatus Omnitrophota bacterium]
MKEEAFSQKELEAIRYIRNFLMKRGHMPSIRKIGRELGYPSPRSASMIVKKLLDKGVLHRKEDRSLQFIESGINDKYRANTVEIPLVGTVACGTPVLAEENIEAVIPVSTKLAKSPYKYFLLRANGDSMNEKNINDGDLVLIRQQQTAKSGDIVVALIDDEATIKEFKKLGDVIALLPRSNNKQYKPIYLERDFKVQGVVVATISNPNE